MSDVTNESHSQAVSIMARRAEVNPWPGRGAPLFSVLQFRERTSMETPVYSHRMTQSEFGAQWAFGVKGSF